jgi:hypothetical protein
MSLDEQLTDAERDADALEALFVELQDEIRGLDEIEAQLDAFSERLDAEAVA